METKFRGKNKKFGTWAYGYYVKIDDTHWIAERDVEFRVAGLDEASYDGQPETGIYGMVEVHPETIGQYTSLKDKAGKESFASDKIKMKIYFGDRPILKRADYGEFEIVWVEEEAGFMLKPLFSSEDELWDFTAECDFEIIGTIHENKELLE
jgi:uncharacterized phage protein (TIGR01671 family)